MPPRIPRIPITGLCGLVFFAAQLPLRAADHPNIVFILADDLGYGDVSCNNPASLIPTPHLDTLAGQGIRFTNAHATASVCSPTRYSILTGRYPWRTAMKEGVLYDFDPALIKRGRTTVASLLHDAQYATAAFGKWHIGLDWTPKPGDTGDWQWGQIVRYDSLRSAARVDFSKPVRNGPIDLGFDTFFGGVSQGVSRHYIQDDRLSDEKVPPGTMDNVFVAKAQEYIRTHRTRKPNQPFFVYLALGAAHSPLIPPKDLVGRSKTGKLGDMVLWVDQSVGKITALLDELKLAENTLVIFTSDNGSVHHGRNDEQGHKPGGDRRGFKTDIWDGGTHVPFIARWPKNIPAGITTPAMISLADMLATFAAITQRPIPAWHGEDSLNMLDALTGKDLNGRTEMITQSYTGVMALRDREWKLILGTESSGGHQGITGAWAPNASGFDRPVKTTVGQLYHVATDPGETTNLWSQKIDVVRTLSARMERSMSQGFTREMETAVP
jgi:arylsulfatase A